MVILSVDVIIPALNEEKYIGRCLESILSVDYPKKMVNVIVADNGSHDKTKEISTRYGVRVVDVERKNIGHTRNVGASFSESEIIAFVDADIVVHQSWLKKAMTHFVDSRIVAVGSYPNVILAESNRLQQVWSILCQNSTVAKDVDWLPSANLLVRRSSFEKINGFNEDLITCEDSDLGYRLKLEGRIINEPEAIVYHLREPANFVEFFKKEIWHSKGNLAGALSHGLTFSELPSLVLPGIFGAGFLMFFLLPVFGKSVVILGVLLIFSPLSLYVVRGLRKVKNFSFLTCLYFVYLTARSYSFYRDLLDIVFAKSKKKE